MLKMKEEFPFQFLGLPRQVCAMQFPLIVVLSLLRSQSYDRPQRKAKNVSDIAPNYLHL